MAQKKNSRKQGGGKSRRHGRKHHKSARHTRKGDRGGSWPQFVKKTYLDMKRKNPAATFKQAMIEASARKRRGEM
jgi:hypothetical protein